MGRMARSCSCSLEPRIPRKSEKRESTIQGPPNRGAIPGLKTVRPCSCLEACCSTWPLWVAVWINANSVLVNEAPEVTVVAELFCNHRSSLVQQNNVSVVVVADAVVVVVAAAVVVTQ